MGRGKEGKVSIAHITVYNCLLFMKKDSSLSCKASRKALLPRLPMTDVRMWLSAVQSANSLILSTTGHWPRIYFLVQGGVTGLAINRISATGIFGQLTSTRNSGVVLIQLSVGVDVTITPWRWRCGAACGLRFARTIKFGIRHRAIPFQAHDEYQ